MRTDLAALAVTVLLLSSCIVPAPSSEEQQGAPADKQAKPAAPPLAMKSGAIIDGRVQILGATATPGQISPGEGTRIQIYFKVLKKMAEDYTIFVHVEDVDGRVERMNVDHQPNNGKSPTSEWKEGDTVRDDFGLYLPPGMPVRGLNLWVGLWEATKDVRLKVTNPSEVRTDGNDRVLLLTVPVVQ